MSASAPRKRARVEVPLERSVANPAYVAELLARGVEYAEELNDVPATTTTRSCGDKRWWRCVPSGHVLETRCFSIASGSGCPYLPVLL